MSDAEDDLWAGAFRVECPDCGQFLHDCKCRPNPFQAIDDLLEDLGEEVSEYDPAPQFPTEEEVPW